MSGNEFAGRGLLEIWWERKVAQDRNAAVQPYPLPHDGASFVAMSNFFSVVGFGDERIITPNHLEILLWINKAKIIDRFLEIWPKSKPDWMKDADTP